MSPSSKQQEMNEDKCIQCGENREAIRTHHMTCGLMSHTEAGSELMEEWSRHRFKPYSEKELARIKADEDEYVRQMGEMADFFEKEMEELSKEKDYA